MPTRSANWLPTEDQQLAKSWLKISEDPIISTGQKRAEFFKRVAEDYNDYSGGIERDGTMAMHRWGHIQKACLKFSGIYHKLKNNRPSGSVLSDLLPDTKKAFYEQEGKQFIFELAWMVVKDSSKFNSLAQTRGDQSKQATTPAPTPTPSTPAAQSDAALGNSQPEDIAQIGSNNSWNRPAGIHATKRAMKQEHFNAKKIKVMSERSSNYRERTIAMKKTNEIRQQVAKAEVNQVNMEIMSRKEDELPDDVSREFLRLQKGEILEDLREQIRERQKLAAAKEKQTEASTNEALAASSERDSTFEDDPSSNAEDSQYIGDEDEDDIADLDPLLDTLA
ncbi:uncharacterized protein PGTG_17114 [Puccinia graminis f. sp. tritici CRL 75-36-700-3]|uniref:No apical meristem-associated C-terminal domain-containing protein n=2 Tax=Puccinia graminis f. sp. tritici TaxID=56615 RepID=E3KLC3_PUCGT|nr:uncharacterized protein PGTG_11267 [Puccinia graminis f. sp. tritici CRL 75-36-700-3]XP_003335676.1 uncharacterized protein PGTG_17114 [Puccinia graminis f. sp. tritici CRL 75-36-700-3]EFP85098.1 hypothetical protein PGTG_11267 [Puccinia graminis f. sp. tritici CRL 75-36-700-3]EFP91257.1 hypothetical protein PGTG_17114 [Puccinia graminis f. sp. tritici CRL 75-36-700-3]